MHRLGNEAMSASRQRSGPSRDVAADFLRYVADYYRHGDLLDDPAAVARAIDLIADCVGRDGVAFRRGGKRKRAVQQEIAMAAWFAEHDRAGGESIGHAIAREAKVLAAQLPDEEDLEGLIAACRKQQKKDGWSLLNLGFPGINWKSEAGSEL